MKNGDKSKLNMDTIIIKKLLSGMGLEEKIGADISSRLYRYKSY